MNLSSVPGGKGAFGAASIGHGLAQLLCDPPNQNGRQDRRSVLSVGARWSIYSDVEYKHSHIRLR